MKTLIEQIACDILPLTLIIASFLLLLSIICVIGYYDSKVDIEAIKAGLHQTSVNGTSIWTKEGCR